MNKELLQQALDALNSGSFLHRTNVVRLLEEAIERPDKITTWQLIDDETPVDNKRMLYLAKFDEDGSLRQIDFDGIWEHESGTWEVRENYWYWASANDIEEPTHWAYQDEVLPAIAQPVQLDAVVQAEQRKDGEIAKIVNDLRDVAVQFHAAQQLRERIAQIVVPLLQNAVLAQPVPPKETK